jgi:glycerol-3-phosphate acyltransferase PlsY
MDLKIYALFITGAYLAGSINFSILVFKILKLGDPREKFSGNAGVTNVYRQAGMLWASIVLLLDMGRSCAVAFACITFLPAGYISWVGLALITGNRFPLFHGFRGGKGVANFLGFSTVINPYAAAIAAQIWVIIYFVIRIPFMASFFMIAILASGMLGALGYNHFEIAGSAAIFIFILINHRKNIQEKFQKKEKQNQF